MRKKIVVPPPPWGDPLTLKRCSWGRFPIYMLELVSNLWTQMQCIQFALSCPQTDLTAAFIHHQIQIARRIEKGMSKWTFELRSITFSCAHFSLSFSSCGCHFSFLFSSSWLSLFLSFFLVLVVHLNRKGLVSVAADLLATLSLSEWALAFLYWPFYYSPPLLTHMFRI